MKPMDKYDQPLLHAAGFEPGWSGQSWFGKDRNGLTWQAQLDEKSMFLFRNKDEQGKWGPNGPLHIVDFRKLFLVGEHE